MKELCINTEEPLDIGSITNGLVLNPDMEYVPIALRIISSITLEEYIKFVKEHKLEHLIKRNIHDKYLYRVEILD